MSLKKINSKLFDRYIKKIISETIASQLPGRQNGGAADAYRHILLSAELTRLFGTQIALRALNKHESERDNGADNGLDMWNNAIGIRIGNYVGQNGGEWKDVVRLSRAVIAHSFDGPGFDQISNWKIRSADEGIRKAYDLYARPRRNRAMSFEKFTKTYKLNREYAFRANDKTILLEDGKLELFPAAVTSPKHWEVNPKVEIDGAEIELTVDEAQFPTRDWFTGKGFVYEDGSRAPTLNFDPETFPEPQDDKRSDFKSAKPDIAGLNRKRPPLPLKPNMHRLLSGDLSAISSKDNPFSARELRFLMGGKVPRVKGATRLHDIARPRPDRFDP